MLVIKPFFLFIIFALGVFLGAGMVTRCTPDKRGEVTPHVITTIKTDTLRIPQIVEKIVYVDKPTLRTVYKDRIIPLIQPDGTPTLSVRNYSDSIEVVPNVHVSYTADVTGTLDHVMFGFRDTRPTEIIERVVTNDITTIQTKKAIGVYGGISGQLDGSSLGPSLGLVTPTLNLVTSYNLVHTNSLRPLSNVQVSLGYKLFGK